MSKPEALTLRPYQQAGIDRFLARHDKRMIFAWAPGAGKTPGAITVAKALGATNVLVAAPARARPTWQREFADWWPEVEAHSICYGRDNKSLTKKQAAQREAAYAAEAQIISYTLLGKNMTAARRSLLIVDELHNCADPQSQQSRALRAFIHAHPDMPVLGLTGTLIRKEVQDVWHPCHMLWNGKWGTPTQAGDVPWSFRKKYCLSREGYEGREVYYGANPATLPELQNKLEPYVHRVVEADFAEYLPEASIKPLFIDDNAKLDAVVATWAEQAAQDHSHVGFLAYYHKTAEAMFAKLRKQFPKRPAFYVSGSMTVETRQSILDAARAAPECIFVGTMESVGESVSLTFLRACLVAEWQSTPGKAVQLIGRFVRAEKVVAPTFVEFVVFPKDEQRAAQLFERTNAVTALLKTDAKSAIVQELMAPRALTDERLHNMHAAMFSEVRLSLSGFLRDEDEEEE